MGAALLYGAQRNPPRRFYRINAMARRAH